MGKTFIPPPQFCCEPKIALKIKVFFFFFKDYILVVETDTSSQSRVYKYTYWAGRNMHLRTQLTGSFRMQINPPPNLQGVLLGLLSVFRELNTYVGNSYHFPGAMPTAMVRTAESRCTVVQVT